MRKVSSGMAWLDEMLGGGLPRPGLVMICGAPGSGKSLLARQVAVGAANAGELVAYVDPPEAKRITMPGIVNYVDMAGAIADERIPASALVIDGFDLVNDHEADGLLHDARHRNLSIVATRQTRMTGFFPKLFSAAAVLFVDLIDGRFVVEATKNRFGKKGTVALRYQNGLLVP